MAAVAAVTEKKPPTTQTPVRSGNNNHDRLDECATVGTLPRVDLDTGANGWASPPGSLFNLRSENYFSSGKKCPSADYLLRPAGVDWLWSRARLDNVLARPDNRARAAGPFVFAVNLQVPASGRKSYSAVFYFASAEPPQPGTLLRRFVDGDDAFRNSRLKMVTRIVKGPWIIRRTVGKYPACLLGRALKCSYHRGDGYMEVDVNVGSSDIASALAHLALGFVTEVKIDMGFVVEAQCADELPERLVGAVRIAHLDMRSARYVDATVGGGRDQEKGR